MRIATAFIMWLLLGTPAVPQTVTRETREALGKKIEQMHRHLQNFSDFAKQLAGQADVQPILDLHTTADFAFEEILAVQTFGFILDSVTCEDDLKMVRPIIRGGIRGNRAFLQARAASIDKVLPAIRQPDIVTEAIQMRDEINDAKGILDSILGEQQPNR